MFSLIKKGIHALRPESCSLCPYGDGTHPPAKIRWDILDKDGKPLASRKRIASGSLLMLPDQVEADRIGGPREALLPESFCEIRQFTELPAIVREVSIAVPPELAGPAGAAVRFERGTFEPSSHFAWTPVSDTRSPRVLDGWMRMPGGPAIPASLRVVRGQPWRPPAAGLRPAALHPIDQEIEVQLRAQPSAFPLQAALPVSVAEKLAWTGSVALATDWIPAGRFMAAPEMRKHRPLYAAPPTPLPVPAVPPRDRTDLGPINVPRPLSSLEVNEDRHMRNWTAAARNPAPQTQPFLTMPYAPLMRQRFRGWQGNPRSYEWRACELTLAAGVQPAESCGPELSAVMLPGCVLIPPERVQLARGPMPNWAKPSDIPLAGAALHSAGFPQPAVAVPEIPD